MAMTAAQKKAAQDLINKANAQKAKLEAQVAAMEKARADAAAADAAAKAAIEKDLADAAALAAAAQADAAKAKKIADQINSNVGLNTIDGILYNGSKPFTGTIDGKNYVNGSIFAGAVPEKDIPFDTTPTLAVDTFRNTLAIYFGEAESKKPWVDGLYKSVSSFYKTGSTVDEAFNLALQASRNDPNMTSFTNRFKGLYALQDLKAKGGTMEVPTIAEYYKTEAQMGQILRATGLNSLDTQDFLGTVIGQGVSATEFANRITTVFDRIDQAPTEIKDTLSRFFPQVDRTSLAKALLTGTKGATELENQIKGYEVLAAAENQGIGAFQGVGKPELVGGITAEQAANYAATGQTYQTAMTGFAQVAQARETEQKLAEISGQQAMGVTGLSEAVLGKNAKRLSDLEKLTNLEEARYQGKSGVGTLASSKRSSAF